MSSINTEITESIIRLERAEDIVERTLGTRLILSISAWRKWRLHSPESTWKMQLISTYPETSLTKTMTSAVQ